MERTRRGRLLGNLWLLLALGMFAALPASADVRLPHVIGSHMVLQRDIELPVWGWAEPGEKVTVKLGNAEKTATADAKGNWKVTLPAMKGGGPLQMTVAGKNAITLKDILIGEVWVCSGQSNMELSVRSAANGAKEAAAAKFPSIRLFHVPKRPGGQPMTDVNATWRPCQPGTVQGFSAVGYFFGRKLHKDLSVPVGLINTSWGGTRIEPWTPPQGFAAVPKLRGILQHIERSNAQYRKAVKASLDALEGWIPAARKALADGTAIPAMPAIVRHPLANAGAPTGLYNGMVHPLLPFAIRGAIWYQGESNRGDGMMYCEKMKALITGWRQVWAQGDFPFYYVQLAPYTYRGSVTALPGIWEAQSAALAIPNTGMAVITDIGNLRDIHPRNKQDVGKRLALWALAKAYGREGLVYSGPLFKALAIEGGKARITFDHVGSGLVSRDGKPLTHFEVAGADKKFAKAEAKIEGDAVVVSSDAVKEPVAVRFGWHQLAEPNLMNKEGLPASPFRTDKW